MKPTVFPEDAKPFTLRSDLAEEIGFCDMVRDSLVQRAFAERRREELDLSHDREEQLYYWHRSLYSAPQFLCYYSAIEPHGAKPIPYIWDGYFYAPIVDPGAVALWGYMLHRLTSLVEGGAGEAASITATKPNPNPESWSVPFYALVHDTQAGIAAVVTWKLSREYTKMNPKRDYDFPKNR